MELKYFRLEEFNCTETGENEMNPLFLHRLDDLRGVCGFPFKITSGYRSIHHSEEQKKIKAGGKPGYHTKGLAADIFAPDGVTKRKIVKEALALGFNGIGVGSNFIHLDIRRSTPVMWGY